MKNPATGRPVAGFFFIHDTQLRVSGRSTGEAASSLNET